MAVKRIKGVITLMGSNELTDNNLFKTISKCFVNNKRPDVSEVFVIYEDSTRERIWTFNPTKYNFDHREFVGKTKIEAVFYCDRKKPRTI